LLPSLHDEEAAETITANPKFNNKIEGRTNLHGVGSLL
jgi:hypothetical protein